jgi:TonB family protein
MPPLEKFGKLVLLERIDTQHLCVVHRAARLGPSGLDRIVTLVRYSEAISTHPDAPSRLAEQLRLASRLKIPGLVRVLGIGRVEQSHCASFELLEGRTLREVIDRARREGFPFTADNALMVASRAAAGLGMLHARRDDAGAPLFHGLVEPRHLVVSWQGEVRLMGFGLWPALRATDVLGPEERRYLAPEQLAGEVGDARSDAYALALVLLEVLTGRAPGGEDPLTTLPEARHLNAAGAREPLPGPLVEILHRGLAREPASRYASIAEMKGAIDARLFSGDLTPTTFNLAFFMHTLFREDIEEEAAALAEASLADYSEFLPRPAASEAEEARAAPFAPAAVDELANGPPSPEPDTAAEATPVDAPSSKDPGETQPATVQSGGSEPDGSALSDAPAAGEPPARAEPPPSRAAASATVSADSSGSGRRARRGAPRRTRERTQRLARTSGPKRGIRGLMLLAALVAAVGVGGGVGYFVLARRGPLATAPSGSSPNPEVTAALARVRELEAQLAELEREKAEIEAQAQAGPEETPGPQSPSPPPARDSEEAALARAEAAARARAEAQRRARAERVRREAEIRSLEEELRAAEERLVGQQAVASAPAVDLSAAERVAPPPTLAPPPTTLPPVRAGDLVDVADPAVSPPVFLSETPVVYPEIAWRVSREGTVLLEALVDETGAVVETRVVESSEPGFGFEKAAIRQVESRRYRPATKSGVRVRVWIPIRVNFTLE